MVYYEKAFQFGPSFSIYIVHCTIGNAHNHISYSLHKVMRISNVSPYYVRYV